MARVARDAAADARAATDARPATDARAAADARATADARAALGTEKVAWGHFPTTRNIPNLARNFALARKLLADWKPDVIMSTGAGIALPFFVLGRLAGIRTVYLEVYDRVDSATLTARLVSRWTDLFLVQWDSQLEHAPEGAVVVGPVW